MTRFMKLFPAQRYILLAVILLSVLLMEVFCYMR
jgi:hypothetical protein